MSYLQLLDYGFFIFHLMLVLFNLFGWLWKPLRRAHLVVLLLTFASWFVLGIWYGWGYCPLTDWHWQVLYKLGKTGLPHSYITYLFDRAIGVNITDHTADILIGTTSVAALILSLKVNFFQKKR